MASTVLPNGIIIPEKFSRDWYADLYHNWQELDNLLGGGTPKDGTLTIQKNGTTVGTFSANQSTNETIDITVPDVNDATLTIQQNGTTVDTFTANSSTDKTVNIAIPTKTSDLTNDSGFITEDNTKIPLAGSNQISGSLIPATTDAYDLGGSSYQWNNLYAKNYYYNGTAWGLDKANQWGANNKFTGNVSITKNSDSPTASSDTSLALTGTSQYIFFRTRGSSNYKSYNSFLWGGYLSNASPYRFGRIRLYRASAIYGETGEETPDTSFSFIDVALHYKWVSLTDNVKFINDGTANACEPLTNNATNLGTSTNKWKSFNGINPGALSLPSSTYINVDTTNWDLTCQNELMGSFTPTADGWLMLHVANSGTSEVNFWIIGGVLRINNKSTLNTTDNNNFNMITIPVEKDVTYNIYGNASEYAAGRSIAYCRFMPCQGNV